LDLLDLVTGHWLLITDMLTLADVAAILDMLGRDPDPQAAFIVFDRVTQRVLGHKLLTVMRHVTTTAEVERIYSSNPRAYPVGGRKQKQGTTWGEQVLDRGEVFIARNREELRAAFADHELIFSLGIGSIMNVPVMLQGRCRGIVNLSHDAGHYGEADIAPARVLAGLLAPVFG
jgi:GAF domain-containing protein